MDVLVIGAGFGGLAAALSLAEQGATVTVCEALAYPGGCASTFSRAGRRFESGATLFCGLAPDQLFGRWIAKYNLDARPVFHDALGEVRSPGLALPLLADKARFLESLCALPNAPVDGLRRFFAEQGAVADALWALFEDPTLLPPLTPTTLARHAARGLGYLPVLRVVGQSLDAVLAQHGLATWAPIRTWLGGQCQITVQCEPDVAEAPYALASMDFPWRGTGQIAGGIGRLAEGLVQAIGQAGGTVRLANRVKGLRRVDGRWEVTTRDGVFRVDKVVANLLPADLAALLGGHDGLTLRHAPIADGWGAVMLYRAVRAAPGPAVHLDLTVDPTRPLVEGNHVYVSLSGDGEGGERTLTASTHVALSRLRSGDPARVVHDVQDQMRATLARLAPELEDVALELPASPRTFQRFLRRSEGAVGGVPRRVGLSSYRQLGPVEVERGLWLAGDSVFPGQSTYAVAVGGLRVAAAVAHGSVAGR
jgi:phytoene dehydrogenase-like protein